MSFAGLTPTTRRDVSRLYDRTNTVRENIASVISRRVGGDTQLRGPGILPVNESLEVDLARVVSAFRLFSETRGLCFVGSLHT